MKIDNKALRFSWKKMILYNIMREYYGIICVIFMDKIRGDYYEKITRDFKIFPICALLGARQVGKTTLARQYAESKKLLMEIHYFDLEDYTDLAKLANPKIALEPLKGLIIIDEIQRRPDLFPYLRVLADRPNTPARFLILGSASKELLKQSGESLAGRIGYIYVNPFGLKDIGDQTLLWSQGGFPLSVLCENTDDSLRWRKSYLQTYFERDLRDIGLNLPPQRIYKLWNLLTHYHGQTTNYAAMAQFMDVSVPSIKNYIALLEGTFLIRTLTPWYENAGKRIVKAPKLYIRDSGMFHAMLDISSYTDLVNNTCLGPSWEGFALEETAKALNLETHQCYFWATHQHAELDLFVIHRGKRIGFEFKVTDQPKVTKSMRVAMDSLNLDYLYIITPVQETFFLEEKIGVLALKDVEIFLNKH